MHQRLAHLPALVAIASAAMISCLTGCQPTAYVMPSSPAMHARGAVASPTLQASGSGDRMTLFYATTRRALGSADSRHYDETFANELRLGVATLGVDQAAVTARETRALASPPSAQSQPMLRLETLDERTTLDAGADLDALFPEAADFFSEIDRAIAASADKDVFVYVHGGNNGVYRTAAQAAQYRQLSGRGSVVVAFVWPTVDNYVSYAADVRNAKRSVAAFARLVELLAKHTRAEHLNILAHSAGVRVVSAALASIGSVPGDRESLRRRLRLGEIYYAAADLEMKPFVGELRAYVDLPLRITVQANRDDLVLAYLAFHSGNARAGRPNFNELNEAERKLLREWVATSRLDIVDVTSDRAGDLPPGGHAFWFERRWVSSDVLLEFTYHAPPAARGLQATNKDGMTRWVFPADYEQRAAAGPGNLHLR